MQMKSSIWPLWFMLLFGAGAMLAPRPAHAFFCTMYMGQLVGLCATESTQAVNKKSWIDSFLENGKKLKNWEEQVKKQQERLDQLNIGKISFSGQTGVRAQLDGMHERDVYEGREACQKGKSAVADEQMELCLKRVMLTNLRFNAMVKMLKEIKERDDRLQKIIAERNGMNSQKDSGRLAKLDNSIAQMKADMANDFHSQSAIMKMYDNALTAVDNDMKRVADKVLAGRNTGLGPVTRNLALKGALAGARMRDL